MRTLCSWLTVLFPDHEAAPLSLRSDYSTEECEQALRCLSLNLTYETFTPGNTDQHAQIHKLLTCHVPK